MQISEAAGGVPALGAEPCRFPKLEECAHFHYERVQLPPLSVTLQTNMDQSLHSQHTNDDSDIEWFMVQVTSGDACWIIQRSFENFTMLDDQLHQCIFDRKISQLPELSSQSANDEDLETQLILYLERFSKIADNSVNCGPVLNWLQMDNKGHRLLVPSEESRSINTPAVAAAYSVRRYVSQARDELNLEVGDMISVIDMASPGESMWWRGKRGFQVGFFPQHCVHIIGDKVPRNMPLPPPVVGPSRRRLKQSGILKERVFGCDLGEHLLNSGNDVPMVLKCCAEFIERNGIVDGIYRLSGVTSNIQKLRNSFDEDRIPNLFTEDILQDIHSVASLLKMYFRELPNPLCTYQLYQSFVNAVQGCNTAIRNSESDHDRLLKMRETVQKLPPPHYRTLEYLMRHLAKVAKHGSSTGMTTRNVAIVWAPNLLRCEALEVGGVAALQGVGVQAVVTEFLICYADLIFCDHLPNFDQPSTATESLLSKKCRPNSLAISTPTKLITLEEARSKHLMNKTEECSYIEVGGGPKNLPKKYHTVIELPSGARKRGHTKRSPLGWRMFFSKSRNQTQGNIPKNRKASTPVSINETFITESDLCDIKRKLRSVKSAESLTSGLSEPANSEDILAPLRSLNKPPGHNRSVSHDSYFDTLQNSQNNSEGSLLDLSEIQLNFELEESEMRIFSEDESLVSSPRMQKESQRRVLTRARPEEYSSTTNSVNPSPKKQPRVVFSPESQSRKRTRLEDQLSDIQYIDCNTPDNVVSTTAVIHAFPESPVLQTNKLFDSYQPKNKSPRNSDNLDKRQSLDLDNNSKTVMTKSFTDIDLNQAYLGDNSLLTTPTPGSPGYKQLGESSSNTTPGISPAYDSSPTESTFQKREVKSPIIQKIPNYENIRTTISITYKSPPRSTPTSPLKNPTSHIYENVILNTEEVDIPTSTASLPVQEASLSVNGDYVSDRPKSLSALEDLSPSKDSTIKANLSSSAICNTSEPLSIGSYNDQKTVSSNHSSASNIQYTASISSAPYHYIDNSERCSPSDFSLSEVVESSFDNLTTSQTSLSYPGSPMKNTPSPNVSLTQIYDCSSHEILTPVSPTETKNTSEGLSLENLENLLTEEAEECPINMNLIEFSPTETGIELSPAKLCNNDKRKSDETEYTDENIYQQVKYFRRSIHEVNALLDLEDNPGDVTGNGAPDLEVKNDEIECKEKNCDQPEVKNECVEDNNYDSLEPQNVHVNEIVEEKVLRDERVYENVEIKTEKEDSVRESSCTVEDKNKEVAVDIVTVPSENPVLPVEDSEDSTNLDNSPRLMKFYEKDSLPPCLRARKLKHQLKTRSLDEEDFEKEFGSNSIGKQNSFDDRMGYKTNSLPKTLNQPKSLPLDDGKVSSLHLAHSSENINSSLSEEEQQKKRERIERYKEERRRILQDRYRSESFKENKEVLLTRLRIFKPKEETTEILKTPESDRPPRNRRRSFRSEDSDNQEQSSLRLEEPTKPVSQEHVEDNSRLEGVANSQPATNSATISTEEDVKHNTKAEEYSKPSLKFEEFSKAKQTQESPKEDRSPPISKPMTESLKSRAAIFEQNSHKMSPPTSLIIHKPRSIKQSDTFGKNVLQDSREKTYGRIERKQSLEEELKDLEFIRTKNRDADILKDRRHTYDTRERESEAERMRRISLDNNRSPRKEKASPTYCIKDMKAIFESKSKQ
ncbi:unnamed protein product [Psylliodes chrysocephalus]|uniref:GTPase-activating protein CdGAPr n=1 Tax=Psylliodes chrysocephalus TaxID=3402493 RepID=A0A9P0DBL9_9CUCU|nr:unnamed protein product [Psylliodes chrysocephala]